MDDIKQRNSPTRHSHLPRTVIWDVAREAGVSIATVSRALNGKVDVASATREKVLHIAQKNGYVTNQQARSLTGRRMVGFTVPVVSSSHFMEIMQGAAERLEEYDASLVVCPTAYRSDQEKSLLKRIQRGGVEGALLVLPSENGTELLQLYRSGYPFVIIDPTLPVEDNLLVVAAANMAGARQATEHLVALGHRRIGAITGPSGLCTTIDRLAGYHAVLTSTGLPIDSELIAVADFSTELGEEAALHLLSLPEPPTAVFAFNDAMAVGTLRAARALGLRVPEDISIIGFDDVAFATYTTPALTTVHQPARELGRAGAELLVRRLQGQTIEACRIELSTRLIVRASTGPAPR